MYCWVTHPYQSSSLAHALLYRNNYNRHPASSAGCSYTLAYTSSVKDYIGSIHYLYKMEEENSLQAENTPQLDDAPFLVVYHHRQRKQDTKPRLPRPLKRPSQSHSIILTRKMAAQIEGRNHPIPTNTLADREEQAEEDLQRQFFSSGELELGIPMEDKEDGDILYNLGSLTISQSYSKLEKTLFGLAPMEEEEVDPEMGMLQ